MIAVTVMVVVCREEGGVILELSEAMENVFFLMIRRPTRATQSRSSAASDVYKGQG